MPAARGPDAPGPGEEPGRADRGLPGRVQVTWIMAGGVLTGGVLMAIVTLTGTMNPGLALYSTSLFCLLGAALGGVHGLALGVAGRPPGIPWTRTAGSLGLGVLAALPGLLLAWVVAVFISLTPVSLSLERPLLVFAVAGGWFVGLAVCSWAAVEGCKAARNALVRWPEARAAGPLLLAVFVVLLFVFLTTDPEIGQFRFSGWSAAVLAAVLTVWIALPASVLGIHIFRRLTPARVGHEGDPA